MVRNWNLDWEVSARRVVQAIAMLAAAAGIGVWGAMLLAPKPQPAPPALLASPTANADIAPVVAWFGAGPASRVKIVSSGLIAAGNHSTAILTVDGGKAQAFGVGQEIAHDLILVDVLPNGIVVRQSGQDTEISMPVLPRLDGFRVVVQ